MNSPSSTSALYRNRLFFLIGAIAGLVIGAYVYYANLPEKPPGPVDVDIVNDPLATDTVARLVHDAHVAIAHLENANLSAADILFREIGNRLPEEVMPVRNLAIGRLLAFRDGKTERAAVEEALKRLREVEPAAATTAWLDAMTALKASENIVATDPDASALLLARATKSLETAELRDDTMATFSYQLFEAARYADDADLQKLGAAALGRAYQRAPDNLFVLGEWLMVQAEKEDASIVETLRASKKTIVPLHRQIQDTVKIDILTMVDEAIEAAGQGNWTVVKGRVRVVFFNSMRRHSFAQGDFKRLKPHPLEFVVHDFSPAFYETYPQPAALSPDIEVRFSPLAADRQLPTIEDAVDMIAVDFDLNGAQDIVVLRPTSVEVYGQAKPASAWQLLTTQKISPGMRGLLVADLDHDRDHAISHETTEDGSPGPLKPHVCYDADVDVVIFGESGLLVLRNELDSESQKRSLVPVEQPADLDVPVAHHGVLVDFDHDSNLDVILATERGIVALLALGNMTFADATSYSHMPPADYPFTSLVPVDWDRDADIDIVATAPQGGVIGYLENKRHGNFGWVVLDKEFDALQGSTSLSLLDCDGNASWDLAGVGATGLQLVQTHSSPSGIPRAMRASQVGDVNFDGLTLGDFDNDGFQDALVWSDDGLLVYRWTVDGTFTIAASMFADAPLAILKCDVADFDADGDQDVAVLTKQGITLYSNEGGNQNHWLEIRTLGLVDNKGKSNHNGIGGLIEVKAGSRYQAQVVHRPVTHFGLGELEKADVIRYLWPNGVPQATIAPVTNQSICETMVLKGSCPYLYTWTGEKFEFFTDLCWAAPIGLQFAEGVLAPAREWEYQMIPGDRLKSRDGLYTLQVTEELWEAAYFESIRLIAIDHAADVEVFSNEKVGPAEIAEHRIHTVRNRRPPVAARDKHARDVLPIVLHRDGTFMRGFDKNVVPGLVDEHYLELDLGNLKDAQQIKLFLTGWIYPTDTSLNVALSRHPELSGPKPPAIWVPDADGTWQETIPYMGFPGGKTKTIVVDLSRAFLTDDFRLRIVTTGELYWDEAFFTVDELPAEVRQTPLALQSADLHYRGFSQARPPRENSPEVYDYQKVAAARKWPSMDGRFTKFGDVRELLTENDDRLVVIGAGDEITLTFAEPAVPLPEGWVRDFVIHNVGWDKDADLNTVYGQSVEPLPFVGMRRYPFPVDQAVPDSPSYREYLRKYQTRTQKHSEFWNTIRDY